MFVVSQFLAFNQILEGKTEEFLEDSYQIPLEKHQKIKKSKKSQKSQTAIKQKDQKETKQAKSTKRQAFLEKKQEMQFWIEFELVQSHGKQAFQKTNKSLILEKSW